MKRLRRTVLSCCLSFLLCVIFLNLSSVKVSAAQVSPDAKSEWFLFPFDDLNTIDGTFDIVSGNYHGSGSFSDTRYLVFTDNYNGGVFPAVIQGHRYLYYFTYTALGEFDYNRTIIRPDSDDTDFHYYLYPDTLGTLISYSNTYVQGTTTITGIVDFVSDKTLQFSTGSRLLVELKAPLSTSGRQDWAFYLLDITESSDSEVNQIVAAIQDQTGQIKDKIDEVLTPEGENNLGDYVDQITDQVDDNLGALGFAHDTVENFIGLFNEEPPAPVISVPPLKIKIKGVEHQFFNGYEYDIRTLESGPLNFLIEAVRFSCSAVLWWAFLAYCLDEFEDLFRR